jgi:hypothetical protein
LEDKLTKVSERLEITIGERDFEKRKIEKIIKEKDEQMNEF